MTTLTGTAEWLGRFPVFDSERRIHLFELLYSNPFLLRSAIQRIGIDNLTSGLPVMVRNTPDPLLQPESTILYRHSSASSAVDRLHSAGYRVAVSDSDFSPEADFVFLDVEGKSASDVEAQVAALQRTKARMVAANIASEEDLQHAHRLGIRLFSGKFLRTPATVRNRSVAASRLTSLQVIAYCQDPNISVPRLASVVSTDAALAYGLLRLANTLLYAGVAPVETLPQALSRLGTQTIVKWVLLLSVAAQRDCPVSYLQLSLERAYMCEQLARDLHYDAPESAFLAGLLSVLDAIMRVPMTSIVRQLPLSAGLQAALAVHQGPVGAILSTVIAWESNVRCATPVVLNAWLDALREARTMLASLSEIEKTNPVNV